MTPWLRELARLLVAAQRAIPATRDTARPVAPGPDAQTAPTARVARTPRR